MDRFIQDKIIEGWRKVLVLLKERIDKQVLSDKDKEKLSKTSNLEELTNTTKKITDRLAVRLDEDLKKAMLDLLDVYWNFKFNIINLDHRNEGLGETVISMQKFFVSDTLYEAFKKRHPEIKNDKTSEEVIKPISIVASSYTEWGTQGPDYWIYNQLDKKVDLYIACNYDDSYSYLDYSYVTKESIKELLLWQNQYVQINNQMIKLDIVKYLIGLYDDIFNKQERKNNGKQRKNQ